MIVRRVEHKPAPSLLVYLTMVNFNQAKHGVRQVFSTLFSKVVWKILKMAA